MRAGGRRFQRAEIVQQHASLYVPAPAPAPPRRVHAAQGGKPAGDQAVRAQPLPGARRNKQGRCGCCARSIRRSRRATRLCSRWPRARSRTRRGGGSPPAPAAELRTGSGPPPSRRRSAGAACSRCRPPDGQAGGNPTSGPARPGPALTRLARTRRSAARAHQGPRAGISIIAVLAAPGRPPRKGGTDRSRASRTATPQPRRMPDPGSPRRGDQDPNPGRAPVA
jgi:hypothetical protein